MNDNKPLVSIVVPVYGVERYLDRCVTSIVNQTHRNLEIILVDDGSPDECPQMCDAWAVKDPRIKVVHKSNGGLASARNAGMDVMTGEYVMFIDSDDYVESGMVGSMLKTALAGDAQMIVCGTRNVRFDDGAYTEIGRNVFAMPVTVTNGEVRERFSELVSNSYCIPVWNKMYDRAFLEENAARFDETVEVGEDTLFNVPLYLKAERIACLPDAFYNYVSRSGSLCNRFKPTWFRDRRLLFQCVEPLMRQWGSEYVNLFANEFIYQTGVILSFLYEDDSAETKALRAAVIREIAQDNTVAQALRGFMPVNHRNVIAAKLLRTHCPVLLTAYGRTVAALKRLKSGRK